MRKIFSINACQPQTLPNFIGHITQAKTWQIVSLPNRTTDPTVLAKKLVRFDWAMKRLLRNQANFDILEGFLSELLHEDFKIQQILESEGKR